jgi:hypothetical protein
MTRGTRKKPINSYLMERKAQCAKVAALVANVVDLRFLQLDRKLS